MMGQRALLFLAVLACALCTEVSAAWPPRTANGTDGTVNVFVDSPNDLQRTWQWSLDRLEDYIVNFPFDTDFSFIVSLICKFSQYYIDEAFVYNLPVQALAAANPYLKDFPGGLRVEFRLLTTSGPSLALACRNSSSAFLFTASTVSLNSVSINGCSGSGIVIDAADTDVRNPASVVQLTNVAFSNNTAELGGAIRIRRGYANITGSTFSANSAAQGAAVYVDAGSALGTVESSVFNDNRAWDNITSGIAQSIGSAIVVAPGACIYLVQDSEFSRNSGRSGGAIFLPEIQPNCTEVVLTVQLYDQSSSDACTYYQNATVFFSVDLLNTTFTKNSASVSGGAIWVNQTQYAGGGINFKKCSFENNQAAVFGGAVYAQAQAEVLSSGSSFTGNAAGISGGAVFFHSYGVGTLMINGSYTDSGVKPSAFDANRVLLTPVSLDLYTNADNQEVSEGWLLKNQYGAGGAIAATGEIQVAISNTTFTNNSASTLGGAFACMRCTVSVNVTQASFTDNRAAVSGGAVVLAVTPGRVIVSGSAFRANMATGDVEALRNGELAPSAYGVDKLACGAGGGGALCIQTLSRSVELSDSLFDGNSAVFGGGIFMDESWCDKLGLACGLAMLRLNLSESNSATRGGSSVYWAGGQPLNYQNVSPGRSDSWPAALSVVETPISVASNDEFNIQIQLLDATMQPVLAVSRPVTISARAKDSDTLLRAEPVLVDGPGATLSNITLYGLQRPQEIELVAELDGQLLATANFSVTIRQCQVPEVTILDRVCQTCRTDTNSSYSFDPRNETCDPCPSKGDCSLGVVAPVTHFWHSHPRSPMLHSCPLPHSCDYPGRQEQLLALQAGMIGNLTGDLMAQQVQVYESALCSEGYEGNVCGSCAPGYGRLRFRCTACPSQGTNAIIYALAQALGFLLVVGMVYLTLRRTARARKQVVLVETVDGLFAHDKDSELMHRVDPSLLGRKKDGSLPVTSSTKDLIVLDSAHLDIDCAYELAKMGSTPMADRSSIGISPQTSTTLPTLPPAPPSTNGPFANYPPPVGIALAPVSFSPGPRYPPEAAAAPPPENLLESSSMSKLSSFRNTRLGKGLALGRVSDSPEEMGAGHGGSGSSGSTIPTGVLALAPSASLPAPSTPGCTTPGVGLDDLAGAGSGVGWGILFRPGHRSDSAGGSIFEALVFYMQMLGLMARIAANYPDFTEKFFNFMDLTSSVTAWTSLDCLLGAYNAEENRAYFRIGLSVLVPVVVAFLFLCFWVARYYARRSHHPFLPLGRFVFERMVISVAKICLFYYSSLTANVLSMFSCLTLDVTGGPYSSNLAALGQYWTQDYDVQCLSGSHLTWALALGIPSLLLFSIGIPLAICLFLLHHRKHLGEARFRDRFGSLYEAYRPQYFWWSGVQFARLLALNVAAECFHYFGAAVQVVSFMLILNVSVMLHMSYSPFRRGLVNALHALPMFAVLATTYIALSFVDPSASDGWLLGMSILLIVINAAAVVLLLLHLYWAVRPAVAVAVQKGRSITRQLSTHWSSTVRAQVAKAKQSRKARTQQSQNWGVISGQGPVA